MSEAAKPEAASGGKKKMIIIMVIAVLFSVGTAVGVTLMLTGGKEKEASAKHAKADGEEGEEGEEDEEEGEEGDEKAEGAGPAYVALEPAFVVNFQDAKKRTKFLKAEISVVAKTPKAQEALTLHMPAVRNSLVMLLSRQVFEDLQTTEGKEKLRVDALAEVKSVIKEQTSKKTAKAVKDLYFSSLVMQ